MTIKVNFFNNTEYYAEDFNRQFMHLISTNGVADKNSFPVGPQGTANGTVTVGTGAAWWNGQFIYSDSVEILSVTPNETLKSRVDYVVLNIDKLNLNATLEVVAKGSTTDNMIILAEITMPGSTSIVTQEQIADCRVTTKFNPGLLQEVLSDLLIGGTIKSTNVGGHRFLEHTGIFNGRNALIRMSTANMNGYPAIINMIEDIDTPDNGNGFVFVLGNGKDGDTHRNSFLRPIYQAHGYGSVNLGSPSVPWDNLYLNGVVKSSNGYTKLPNGLIIQWGTVTLPANTNTNIFKLPITFPTANLNAHVTALDQGNTSVSSACRLLNFNDESIMIGNSRDASLKATYFCIGY